MASRWLSIGSFYKYANNLTESLLLLVMSCHIPLPQLTQMICILADEIPSNLPIQYLLEANVYCFTHIKKNELVADMVYQCILALRDPAILYFWSVIMCHHPCPSHGLFPVSEFSMPLPLKSSAITMPTYNNIPPWMTFSPTQLPAMLQISPSQTSHQLRAILCEASTLKEPYISLWHAQKF